jgi:hypothetical protein
MPVPYQPSAPNSVCAAPVVGGMLEIRCIQYCMQVFVAPLMGHADTVPDVRLDSEKLASDIGSVLSAEPRHTFLLLLLLLDELDELDEQ